MLHLASEILSKINRKTLILGIIETGMIIGMFAYIILREPAPTIKTQDVEKPLRDSISLLMKKYDVIQQDKMHLAYLNDSLINLKTNIQIVYETRIKYVEHAPLDTVYNFIKRELHSSN